MLFSSTDAHLIATIFILLFGLTAPFALPFPLPRSANAAQRTAGIRLIFHRDKVV